MSDTLTHGIDLFLRRFKQAKDYGSKDLRLTIQEAEQLSVGISLILSRELVLSNRVIELQDRLIQGNNTSSGEVADGGRF